MLKIKQIIIGIIFIIAGVIPIWFENDITVAFFTIPLGLFVLYVTIFKTKADK